MWDLSTTTAGYILRTNKIKEINHIQTPISCFRMNSTASDSHARGEDGGESHRIGEDGGEVHSIEDANQSAYSDMGNSTASG